MRDAQWINYRRVAPASCRRGHHGGDPPVVRLLGQRVEQFVVEDAGHPRQRGLGGADLGPGGHIRGLARLPP